MLEMFCVLTMNLYLLTIFSSITWNLSKNQSFLFSYLAGVKKNGMEILSLNRLSNFVVFQRLIAGLGVVMATILSQCRIVTPVV